MVSDTLELVVQLEEKIGRLLDRHKTLTRQLHEARRENQALLEERDRFRAELDRIIDKLTLLDEETL